MFSAKEIKRDFPIFANNPGLVYLDSTATSQKPKAVIEKENEYYEKYNANVFRGVYAISERATREYEATREKVKVFLGAEKSEEIVFTRNTSESINLVAYGMGKQIVGHGDEVVTTVAEHHSNFVPWQQLAFENGADFKVIDILEDGKLDIVKNGKISLDSIITLKTKILALTYISNVLGTVNPIAEIIAEAKRINPKVITVVDAAQAVPHRRVNVKELGCDFLAFSSHKMLGPTGVGILWGRYELLESMFPFNFGGEMIASVSIESTSFKPPPHKFEAGTPHIAGVIGLGAAIDYLQSVGFDDIQKNEKDLTQYCLRSLNQEFGAEIKVVGKNAADRAGIIAFTFAGYHPHDIAQILDESNIAVRAGHHCAMPLHTRLKLLATTRASFYLYNTRHDIDEFIEGLKKVKKVLQ